MSPNTCTPKLTKPATKPVNGKKKRVVVAKKISPVSGNFGLFLYYMLHKVTHIIICFLFFIFFMEREWRIKHMISFINYVDLSDQ